MKSVTLPRSARAWRCVAGFVFAGLLGLRAETLVVATFNVENYGPANRQTEAGYRQDYPKPETEKQALRTVIAGLRADLLVLQEMGGPAYLEELRRDLRTEGIEYAYSALAAAADEDRHVAILAKRPLRDVRTHTRLEFPYFGRTEAVKRGLLEVTVETAAGPVTIFALHLKSRFTDRKDDPESSLRRVGEATAIRDAVLRRFPDPAAARFLMLGDCNDGRTSRTLARLTQRGKTAIAELLSATDSRGESWTHAYRREDSYTRVDQILVSPGLSSSVVDGAARIYDGPGAREASDHRAVLVTLQFLEKNPASRVAGGTKG